jgi:hypothetical protein
LGNETWQKYFEQKAKTQSVNWHHANSSQKRNKNLPLL